MITLLISLMVCLNTTSAQVTVTVKVTHIFFDKIGAFLTEKNVEPVFLFYFDSLGVKVPLQRGSCLFVEAKDGEKVMQELIGTKGPAVFECRSIPIEDGKGNLKLYVQGYENDKGELCEADKGDDFLSEAVVAIDLAKLKPGVSSDTLWTYTANKKFGVAYKLLYSLEKPLALQPKLNGKKLLAVTDSLVIQSAHKSPNYEGINYEWEVRKVGEKDWKPLRGTPKPGFVLNPALDIFTDKIYKKEEWEVRMYAKALESVSEAVVTRLTLSPPVPQHDIKTLKISSSCPNEETGAIKLTQIKGYTKNYQVILRSGADRKLPCADGTFGGCDDIVKKMVVKSNEAIFSNLAPGDYTILLGNAEVDDPENFNIFNAHVTEFQKLEFREVLVKNNSCPTSNDGEIKLTLTGGHPGIVSWMINPQAGSIKPEDRAATISTLPPGEYYVIARDECSQVITTKTLKIGVEESLFSPQIGSSGSGADSTAVITIDCNDDTRNYDCKLKDGSDVIIKSVETTGGQARFENLPSGQYMVEVAEITAGSCRVWKGQVKVE